jgi:hypothetical protein
VKRPKHVASAPPLTQLLNTAVAEGRLYVPWSFILEARVSVLRDAVRDNAPRRESKSIPKNRPHEIEHYYEFIDYFPYVIS